MSCMICRRMGRGRMFEINKYYGNADNTVRDDIIEIFGMVVEEHLNPYDSVCNMCMNMIENLCTLKRNLWLRIINPSGFKYPLKNDRLWHLVATLKVDEINDEEPITPCRTPTPSPLTCRTVTPNHTLTSVNSLPCDISSQQKIAEEEYHRGRSLSRASSKNRSDVEVEQLLGRRTRRKRRGWGWTHVKGRNSARNARSAMSEPWRKPLPRRSRMRSYASEWANDGTYREGSPYSDCSYQSFYKRRPRKKKPAAPQKLVLRYDEYGRFLNKRTRLCVSRLQEEQLGEPEEQIFYCGEGDCTVESDDLDLLTNLHKIGYHNCMALYFCEVCNKRYTTAEHLKIHEQIHDTSPFICMMCRQEIATKECLQRHLQEHVEYSEPCAYCDLSFLDTSSCDDHVKQNHGRSFCHDSVSPRKIHRKKLNILRIDSYEEDSNTDIEETTPLSFSEKHYEAVLIIQRPRENLDVSFEPVPANMDDSTDKLEEDIDNSQATPRLNCSRENSPVKTTNMDDSTDKLEEDIDSSQATPSLNGSRENSPVKTTNMNDSTDKLEEDIDSSQATPSSNGSRENSPVPVTNENYNFYKLEGAEVMYENIECESVNLEVNSETIECESVSVEENSENMECESVSLDVTSENLQLMNAELIDEETSVSRETSVSPDLFESC